MNLNCWILFIHILHARRLRIENAAGTGPMGKSRKEPGGLSQWPNFLLFAALVNKVTVLQTE